MNRLSRSTALKIAAVLMMLLSLGDLVAFQLPDLMRGASAVNQAAEAGGGPPFFIVIIGFAVDIIALVAAYGAWQGQKWGVVMLIVIAALQTVQSGLAFLGSPEFAMRITAMIAAIASALAIVLCLWRGRKPTLA